MFGGSEFVCKEAAILDWRAERPMKERWAKRDERWAYAPSGVRPSFTLQAMWNDYSEFVCKAAAILDWHHSTQTVQQNWYHCTRRWVEFDSQVGVTRRVWNSSIKTLVSTPNGNCVPMLAIQCNSVKAMPQSKAALQILQTDNCSYKIYQKQQRSSYLVEWTARLPVLVELMISAIEHTKR